MNKSVFSNKIFGIACGVSIVSHALFFLKIPGFSPAPAYKEVTTVYSEEKIFAAGVAKMDVTTKKSPKDNNLEVVKKNVPVQKEYFKKVEDKHKEEPVKESKDKIEVKNTGNKAICNDDFLCDLSEFYNYRQYLRQTIKETISYAGINLPRKGEVIVEFKLLCDGTLKDVFVREDLSINDVLLRNRAVKSVQDAAPFKSFPKELALKEMVFQIPISFESVE
ncbi:MAG: hypothetical protein ABH836_07875 [Candidatus Omnitrophota bacterium]